MTEDENSELRKRAGDLSVSSYVRECLFEKDTARRKRRSYRPVADQQALAQVLSKLARFNILWNRDSFLAENMIHGDQDDITMAKPHPI